MSYFEFSFIIAKVCNLNTNLEGLFLIMFHNGMVGNLDAKLEATLLYIL
jgi:hypothetical protein